MHLDSNDVSPISTPKDVLILLPSTTTMIGLVAIDIKFSTIALLVLCFALSYLVGLSLVSLMHRSVSLVETAPNTVVEKGVEQNLAPGVYGFQMWLGDNGVVYIGGNSNLS